MPRRDDPNPLDDLCEHCRKKLKDHIGTKIYIAARSAHERSERDKLIEKLFNGSNLDTLADLFNLSVRHVRRILTGK